MATKRLKRISQPAPADDDTDYGTGEEDEAPRPTLSGKQPVPKPKEEHALRKGWGASQQVIDSTSSYAQAFRADTNSQIVKFLDTEPYASFRRHWVDRVGLGKRAYVCLDSLGQDCPLCDIGDKPGAVTAFNIAVVADDGVATVKSWDCGVKLTQQLRTFNHDPKIGPLDKRSLYFAVSKTEAKQRQQVTTIVTPARERDLLEDWGTPPLDDAQLAKLQENAYTADIITLPTKRELEEIAIEISGEDPAQRGFGSD